MLAIIIFNEVSNHLNNIVGGIYKGIDHNTALKEIGEKDLLYFIPLTVSGRTYQERKNDLRNKAIEYQNSCCDFCGFSYGELADIQAFFENNGRKYGLLNEFRENAIC